MTRFARFLRSPCGAVLALGLAAACSRPGGRPTPASPEPAEDDTTVAEVPVTVADRTTVNAPRDPAIQPRIAMLAGLMPLSSMAVTQFLQEQPTADGRGVIIGVLDSGVDPGMLGMQTTTTGEPKLLDLRDFSGEGAIALAPVRPSPDGSVTVAGKTMRGFAVFAGHASPPYYAGVLRELPLGAVDVNGNRRANDTFPLIVGKTGSGWAVITDTDEDGLLDDESPVHDYLVAREILSIGRGLLNMGVNFREENGEPVLVLFFDNDGHGSHVSGIAAGHNMFGENGFNGVAPGAQILALKIADNLRGGITTTGSMLRAMNYAANFAQQRGVPLVINMSFGVGNETEGAAAIDSIVNEFSLKHPDVPFVISAGNDGPGISTVGFPGSAEHVISACALFPGVFSGPRPQGFATDADGIADFSSRGGELAKPDLCAPGLAFSNVPPFFRGNEVSGGTSMAAPQVSGAAALLQSAALQRGRPARAIDIKQAMMASAVRPTGATTIDMGRGVPKLPAANRWLLAGHQAGRYTIRALPDGGNSSTVDAAYRRHGFASTADTVQRFEITPVGGQAAARFLLESDAPWLRTPRSIELSGGPATVPLRYLPNRMRTPGLYVGSVWATPASDTLAGPAFRLTNTIVVPQILTQPFVEGRDLGPGRASRYFFDIPGDAGGFAVEVELRYRTQRGSFYVFEPDGQPYRGEANIDVGGSNPPKVRITVPDKDVVPGVYEVVVVAPPTEALSFELRVALPRYVIREVGDGPTAVVGLRADAPSFLQDAAVFQRTGDFPPVADSVQLIAQAIGAVRTFTVTGRGSHPESLAVRVPRWANEVIVDVQLPPGAWNQYTDMGVTLFDSIGAKVGEGPLSYRYGRFSTKLERFHRNHELHLELFPAFAHLEPPATWTADVQVSLIAASPTDLTLADVDTTTALSMAPGQFQVVRFSALPTARVLPAGYLPLVEVTTNPAGGAPARRRQALSRP